MPKAALPDPPALPTDTIPPTSRQQAVNAMVLLYDTLHTDREKGAIMELFVTFAWRIWTWNVEKFIKDFNAAQNHNGQAT